MRASGERRKGLLFISPFLVGFTVFTVYPIAASLYYSFCDFDMLNPPRWAGLANFREMFTDELFVKGLWNTLVFTVFSVPVTMLTALVLAFLLNMKLRGQALYRTIFFLPSIVPLVASSVLWLWLLNPDYGLINHCLRPFYEAASWVYAHWLGAPAGFKGFHVPGWLVDKTTPSPR